MGNERWTHLPNEFWIIVSVADFNSSNTMPNELNEFDPGIRLQFVSFFLPSFECSSISINFQNWFHICNAYYMVYKVWSMEHHGDSIPSMFSMLLFLHLVCFCLCWLPPSTNGNHHTKNEIKMCSPAKIYRLTFDAWRRTHFSLLEFYFAFIYNAFHHIM